MNYELIIIGGGPAGASAGVYAARKRIRSLLITHSFGGQSVVSPNIENWIGRISITGLQLAKELRVHLENYKGEMLQILDGERVSKVTSENDEFRVDTGSGKEFTAQVVLVATGSSRRKLTVLGADRYDQRGLTYCASCDGPFYADKKVAVIGGGNAGFESAAQLLAYCRSVTLIHKHADFKADKILVEKLLAHPHFKVITNAEILEIKGNEFAHSLIYKDKETSAVKELPAEGIFVEIGALPATNFVKDLVSVNQLGAIVVDPHTQRTTMEGIWAAGDCTDGFYHQNNIAAGDAVRALEDIYNYLRLRK